jgi:uncharacterized protein YjiS (DUF1127 family)
MTMTAAVQSHRPTLREIAQRFAAPRRESRDPLGLMGGWRAYVVYKELDRKSDAELNALGLSRTDIARVAFEAIGSADR